MFNSKTQKLKKIKQKQETTWEKHETQTKKRKLT